MDQHPTEKLSIDELIVSWPRIVDELEKIEPWATFAFRLGIIEQIRALLWEMTEPDAHADLVARVRERVEVLARLPWET